MKASVLKDKLVKGAQTANKIAVNKSNLPIVSHLLLTAFEENYIQIESTNLEISIRLKIPAKVEEAGSVTVPAKTFTDLISVAHDETILLEKDQKQLFVSSGSNKAQFVTMPVDDFPELPVITSGQPSLIIEKHMFQDIVKKTTFAASSADTHPVLTGCLLTVGDDKQLTLVGTDSFRLSLIELPVETAQPFTTIVPATALNHVSQLISDVTFNDEEQDHVIVFMSEQDNQIFFKYGEVELISRVLDAEYPPYQRVFPESFVTNATFDRSELIESIKTTSIFASREGQAIKCDVQPDSGKTNLSARSTDVGSYEGSITGDINGDALVLGFNSKYLVDALQAFSTEKITMQLAGSDSAALIQVEEHGMIFKHIIMPMSISDPA